MLIMLLCVDNAIVCRSLYLVPETPRAEVSNANLLKNPSKVLLLRVSETLKDCQVSFAFTKCLHSRYGHAKRAKIKFLQIMPITFMLHIVLLFNCVSQNMVGPGEVDGELEQETADECQKYGKVVKCVIFEVRGRQRRTYGSIGRQFW